MRQKINCWPVMVMIMTVVLMVTSCSKSPEYAKLIPDDATMVMRIDVKKMADCGNMDNEQIKTKLLDMLKTGDMSATTRDKLKEIIDDPAEAGIDLRDPLLFYASATGGNPNGGLLGTIHDADKLTELLTIAAKEAGLPEVKTKEEICYVYGNGIILAYNDNTFCLKQTMGKDEEQAAGEMTRLLGGEMNYTKGESDFVKRLLAADGVMQTLVMGDFYESMPQFQMIKQTLPEGAALKDVACLFDLTLDKGEAKLKYEMLTASDAWKKAISNYDDAYQPISGDLLEYMSNEGLTMILNCDGEKFFSSLEANNLSKTIGAGNMQQAKELITTFNGNFALNVHGIDLTANKVALAVYAKTKNAAITTLLGALMGNKAQTGYKDGTSYILYDTDSAPFTSPANAMSKGDATGKRLYISFSFDMLRAIAASCDAQQAMAMNMTAQILEKAEITYEGEGKGCMTVTMRDKSQNPLAACISLILSNLN